MDVKNDGVLPEVEVKPWGEVNGEPVYLYRMVNSSGARMNVTNYGARVTSLKVPDDSGEMVDVVLGFDKLEKYAAENPYLGAIVGRYGNRISNGNFGLDGREFSLVCNDGDNHLHGGYRGFDRKIWRGETVTTREDTAVKLRYLSRAGEEGYPGNLEVSVTYKLTNDNELVLNFEARTDEATIVNLTNHNYYNLNGIEDDVLDHVLTINADRFTPTDEESIPTGELRPVEGTPMDFRSPTRIGKRIDDDYEQLKYGKGYDHNYVLTGGGTGMSLAGAVSSPETGIVMKVYTDQPGIQFYSGNYLDGSLTGKNGLRYEKRSAFCLETQDFPDSPNNPNFPSTVLRPGEEYGTSTVFDFSVG